MSAKINKSAKNNTSIKRTQINRAVDSFWALSTQFYRQQSVQASLLELQNDQQMNVNHCLFALWFSYYQPQTLQQKQLTDILEQSQTLQSWITRVRAIRVKLPSQAQTQPDYQFEIRQQLLACELSLEQMHQRTMVEACFSSSQSIKPAPITEPSEIGERSLFNLQQLCAGIDFARKANQPVQPNQFEFLISAWLNFIAKTGASISIE